MAVNREFEGKDLAEALHTASRRLGIPEPELHYTIVDQGRRGLLGIGARAVRIRVKPPVEIPSKSEVLAHSEPEAAPEAAAAPAERPARSAARGGGRGRGTRATPPAESGAEKGPRGRRQRRRRKRGPGAPPNRGRRPARAPRPSGPGDSEGARPVVETVRRILELAELDIQAEGARFDSEIVVSLSGGDLDGFASRDADGARALQFLLNRMTRRMWPDVQRITVGRGGAAAGGDEPGPRDEELVELTREVAQQVATTGRSKLLHEMNAYERRIVHLTVREMDGLRSRSEGDGGLKRVRISRRGGGSRS